MTITLKQLSRYKTPCKGGVIWFKKQKSHTLTALVKTALKNKSFNHDGTTYYPLNFALWALPRLMTKYQAVQFVVYAAREVLGIYEAEYPNDDRPRRAIEAAEAWLKNPCPATAEAVAWAAADAAWAAGAAGAAGATAEAAEVAWAAAVAAIWAAAGTATWAAAGAATWTTWVAAGAAKAAKHSMAVKIVRYGVKILEKKIRVCN